MLYSKGGILLNENAYIYNSKIIEVVFFAFLTLIVVFRLDIGLAGVKVVEYLYENLQFIFVPIAVCLINYRVNRYYDNTFIRIRSGNQKQWKKSFFIDNLKASLLMLGLYYLIQFICCFEMNGIYLMYTLSLLLQSSLIVSICAMVNVQLVIAGKTSFSYLFCIVFHMLYGRIFLSLVPCLNFYEDMMGDMSVIFHKMTLVFLCLNLIMLFCMSKGFHWKQMKKKSVMPLICILLFVFQNFMFRNLSVKESLGFPDILFISVNEILMPLFVWVLSTLALMSVSIYVMFTNYRSHLLFYAIRIQNRTVWFLKTFGKATMALAIILTLKYGIDALFQNQTMSYVMYMVEGMLRLQFFCLLLFLIYQIYKNEKLFSYALLGYLLVVLFCVIMHHGDNLILMRIHSVETIMMMALSTAGLLLANCYAINHLDYY